MHAGARLADPARIDVRGELVVGQDVEIDVGCVFEGRVVLGDGVKIGAHCVVSNAHLSGEVVVKPFTHIQGESSAHLITVGEAAQLGPYARLRAGTVLGAEVHIGNFVEIKNSTLGVGSKANHLAYVGDAQVGDRVNVGAGSITANYDGANKHTTVIEDDVHVGSNSVLVAPVTIAQGGTVGAGSVISKDTQAGALTLTRAKTVSLAHWRRPQKNPTKPSSG
jgi:bifunctional UDP-N-acetylglucosamine pyrophosphorylase/glucosamine-1-phosphate N-acetyltransferase